MRGFGMTFDVRNGGGVRWWYIDGEGAKRWADNDELVDERTPTPAATEGESG